MKKQILINLLFILVTFLISVPFSSTGGAFLLSLFFGVFVFVSDRVWTRNKEGTVIQWPSLLISLGVIFAALYLLAGIHTAIHLTSLMALLDLSIWLKTR